MGTPSGVDMMSYSVIEQNTSVGSFCSTETLVMRTTQCSKQMSSIVFISYRCDNKLATTSLPCIQCQMGEQSDTQGDYLPVCSELKSHPGVKTKVF